MSQDNCGEKTLTYRGTLSMFKVNIRANPTIKKNKLRRRQAHLSLPVKIQLESQGGDKLTLVFHYGSYGAVGTTTIIRVWTTSFRHCFGSELSRCRGLLISPAGPLYIAGRQLVFSKAVRRVWTASGGGFGGGSQFDADCKAAFWEATGSPIQQAAAMKIYEKTKPVYMTA